ncbi:unnamed protein product [Musa acuminata subsp. malaccensis]|uniref:(wild Malaysian banana) hypothetical protein n=1 Tax=Musa acuminata subsp. malaccensis TaxID=214687 RepID=A0A804L8Y7_MUSAM|nr:unnamed protein product [Musa acuminata subsp. malaccensis]
MVFSISKHVVIMELWFPRNQCRCFKMNRYLLISSSKYVTLRMFGSKRKFVAILYKSYYTFLENYELCLINHCLRQAFTKELYNVPKIIFVKQYVRSVSS